MNQNILGKTWHNSRNLQRYGEIFNMHGWSFLFSIWLWGTEFQLSALRPFSLSKLYLTRHLRNASRFLIPCYSARIDASPPSLHPLPSTPLPPSNTLLLYSYWTISLLGGQVGILGRQGGGLGGQGGVMVGGRVVRGGKPLNLIPHMPTTTTLSHYYYYYYYTTTLLLLLHYYNYTTTTLLL